MLKPKDFVFALLTLICVSPVAGEEQVYPEAKEWPKYAGFEWGISEDEFFQVCAKKNLKRLPIPDPVFKQEFLAKGKILGRDAEIEPGFERREGEGRYKKGVVLSDLFIRWKKIEKEDSEELFDKLRKILTDKYGKYGVQQRVSKYGGLIILWGAPGMPNRDCLRLIIGPEWESVPTYGGEGIEGRLTGKYYVNVIYYSKAYTDKRENNRKRKAAEKRELEKKAKEDEKDF